MQETYDLRPAVEADQPGITALVRAARLYPRGLDWPNFQLAEANGQIVGVGQIRHHRDGSRELASLAVRPEWQGHGVGSAICQALIERERGPLYLMCRDKLEGYYTRFGFRIVEPDVLPAYFRKIYRLAALIGGVLHIRLVVMMRAANESEAESTKLR